MPKRLAITSLLGLALLFSQGGVLLIAALCPHLRLTEPVCSSMASEAALDHSQMIHHEMDHGSLSPATVVAQSIVFAPGAPRPCSHCIIHARTNSKTTSARTAETVKRSVELKVAQAVSVLPFVVTAVASKTRAAHGPPGDAGRPRHVLFSTFRI